MSVIVTGDVLVVLAAVFVLIGYILYGTPLVIVASAISIMGYALLIMVAAWSETWFVVFMLTAIMIVNILNFWRST